MESNYIEMIMDVNSDNTLDITRLLILINVFTNKNKTAGIEGITKLAIFEFLLKYPYALQKIVEFEQRQKPKSAKQVNVKLEEYEKESIEAHMMALNFAPWNYKYRNEISVLSAKKLISLSIVKNKVDVCITDEGINVVNDLLKCRFYKDIEIRSKIIKLSFKSYGTSTLINKIYQVFPDILDSRIELDVTYED